MEKYDDKYLNSSDDRKSLNINYAQEPEVETCQAMLPDQVIVIVIMVIMVIMAIMVIIIIIIINSITGKAARKRERK